MITVFGLLCWARDEIRQRLTWRRYERVRKRRAPYQIRRSYYGGLHLEPTETENDRTR